MTRVIAIPGFRLDKSSRVVRNERALSVSERLRRKSSKRVKPMRKGQLR